MGNKAKIKKLQRMYVPDYRCRSHIVSYIILYHIKRRERARITGVCAGLPSVCVWEMNNSKESTGSSSTFGN